MRFLISSLMICSAVLFGGFVSNVFYLSAGVMLIGQIYNILRIDFANIKNRYEVVSRRYKRQRYAGIVLVYYIFSGLVSQFTGIELVALQDGGIHIVDWYLAVLISIITFLFLNRFFLFMHSVTEWAE